MEFNGFCDLHTHSTASDGTDTPQQLVSLASQRAIVVLALTDHDNVNGARQIVGAQSAVRVVAGVELSSRTSSQKCHILGLGIDPDHAAMAEVLEKARQLRLNKLQARIDALKHITDAIPEYEFDALRNLDGVGKPHLANLMLKYAVVKERAKAFEILNDMPTPPSRLNAQVSVNAILAAGGIPVWAHPMGEEGRSLTFEQMTEVLPQLVGMGIRAMECWYSKYPVELCEKLELLAKQNHLYVSGGSDYHGTNKTVALGQLNAQSAPVNAARITVLEAL